MDGNEVKERPWRASARRRLAAAGLVASGLLAGGILAGTHIAGAQSPSSSSSASSSASNGGTNPATMRHGPGETLLTDGTASKVKAAALAAVPGGTIIRVETDSDGSPYEAHVRKADGTFVTVKVDRNFKVTSIQTGFGGGPHGSQSNGTGA
ncbi:MAG: hypothetical protein E6G44_10835 [Actinobacteria bacterium]|nr:MAG: hypothetical protein E6G44_10835 [Actinomycetota bacterium]